MEEELESQYRINAQLQTKRIDNQLCFITKVIYDELLPYIEYERLITGQYHRGEGYRYKEQTYCFPSPKGQTIQDLIKQNKPFNLDQIYTIIQQILQALLEIHKKKSLGRCFDIKNIYYDNRNITLTAFGFYPDLQLKPPEFIRRKSYSTAIDMWLLGCVIYSLFTNKIIKPFKTIEEYQQFYVNLTQENIDQQYKELLYKMLLPNEVERLTFYELYSKSIFENQQQYNFYFNHFRIYDFEEIISYRESIDQSYLEWAVPKEFQDHLKVPIIQIRHGRAGSINIPEQGPFPTEPLKPIIIDKQPYVGLPAVFKIIGTQPLPKVEKEEEDPDCPFLTFRNRSKAETALYGQVWREIHFQSYRFYFLNELFQILSQLEQLPYIQWAKYSILKMSIIIRNEFINKISNEENFCKIDQKLWKEFLTNSKQFRQQFRDLSTMLSLDMSEIENLYRECQENNQKSGEEIKLFENVKQQFTKDVNEKTFEEFKGSFRNVLAFLYKKLTQNIKNETDEENKKSFAVLQLKVIICMTINSIFNTPQYICEKQGNRDENFQIARDVFNIQQLNSPYYVNKFFEIATLEQLQQQKDKIHQIYF